MAEVELHAFNVLSQRIIYSARMLNRIVDFIIFITFAHEILLVDSG